MIAIDGQALKQIGQWPWSRAHHADILNFLVESGASDVFFDVDFAFASDPEGDAQLISALDRNGGGTYLPVFAQARSSLGRGELIYNFPHEPFAQRSWFAFVNVFTQADGRVHSYPYGGVLHDEFLPSAASLLSGTYIESNDVFQIDFRINPNTLPVYSAADLLNDELNPLMIQNKSVIVGGTAVELGDQFAVPIYGVIPGPMIHALAAETLISASPPVQAGSHWTSVFHSLSLLFSLLLFRKRAVFFVGSLTTFLLAGEFIAFQIFSANSTIIATSQTYPAAILFSIWHLMSRLGINSIVIRNQAVEVANTKGLLQTVFEDSFDAIIVVGEDCKPITASNSALTLLGAKNHEDLEVPDKIIDTLKGHFRSGISTPAKLRTTLFRINNKETYLEYMIALSTWKDAVQGEETVKRIATISLRDVTKLKQQQRHISYLSNYDEQTGALRRAPFLEFLKLRIASDESFAVFALNLHRFKTINVTLGRHVGDALLKEVVNRLELGNRNLSSPVRLGGDSFALYTEAACTQQEADDLARWISDVVSKPYKLEHSSAQVGGIVGYYLHEGAPDGSISPQDLLSRAEEALDTARLNRSTTPVLFSPLLSNQQLRARQIERSLISALEKDEFFLTYQPQHRVKDGALIGSEALIRWTSSSLGMIFPDDFIEIAESTGFISELGRWILIRAFEETMQASNHLSIAVNVSGIQLINTDIVSDLKFALDSTGIDPARVCLELTESVFLSSLDHIVSKMNEVRKLGVTWALDDFGTGYSSLSYLSMLPLDKIKLDKSFTMDLHESAASNAITHSVVELCKGLGVKLLCEGVELEAHLISLREKGVSEAQGYYFSKPLTQTDFCEYVKRHLEATDNRNELRGNEVKKIS